MPMKLLTRDRTASTGPSPTGILEVAEFGLRDAQCVARSPLMVGDPFLRG
jgi:hypothetical protein